MKTSMGLPWNKFQQGRRHGREKYSNTQHMVSIYSNVIIIPSEQKLRELSEELLVTDLKSELAPFSFGLKYGGEDLRPAPLVYVGDLVAFTLHLLE